MTREEFSRKLVELREASGVSRREMVEHTNVSITTIKNMEYGTVSCKISLVIAYLSKLECKLQLKFFDHVYDIGSKDEFFAHFTKEHTFQSWVRLSDNIGLTRYHMKEIYNNTTDCKVDTAIQLCSFFGVDILFTGIKKDNRDAVPQKQTQEPNLIKQQPTEETTHFSKKWFSEQLRRIRILSKKSQETIAKEINTSVTTVQKMEVGCVSYKLARVLEYIKTISHVLCLTCKNTTKEVASQKEILDFFTEIKEDISWESVEQRINVYKSKISKIENNESSMSIDIFLNLCKLFSVSITFREVEKIENKNNEEPLPEEYSTRWFSNKLKEIRKNDGCSLNKLAKELQSTASGIHRIERAEHSYKMDKVIKYLHSLEYSLYIHHNKYNSYIRSYTDIPNFIRKTKGNLSYYELSRQSKCSRRTLEIFLTLQNIIRVDTFLKICYCLNIKIDFVKNEDVPKLI